MGIQYNEKTIIDKCEEAMKNPALFYKQGLVNYKGICSDTNIPYTEVIADYLMEHFEEFKRGILKIQRKNSYCTGTHESRYDLTSNRTEELTAMKLFNYCKAGRKYEKIGTILDYQIPLKDKQSDVAGKIDLLAYDGRVLHILELKKPGIKSNQETMLRCVLEGYTYLRIIDTVKLISDFNEKEGVNIPLDTPVKASPLTFKDSLPYREWKEIDRRPKLKALMELLDSEPFFIREVSKNYEIF